MKQHIYCPRCGRNRWDHLLSGPCRHPSTGSRRVEAKRRDWSGAFAWALIAVTAAWVLARMPW